jgi:hypothetical protein
MEFFGILHCVQDDSNYKDDCNCNCNCDCDCDCDCNCNFNCAGNCKCKCRSPWGMTNRAATAGVAEG